MICGKIFHMIQCDEWYNMTETAVRIHDRTQRQVNHPTEKLSIFHGALAWKYCPGDLTLSKII